LPACGSRRNSGIRPWNPLFLGNILRSSQRGLLCLTAMMNRKASKCRHAALENPRLRHRRAGQGLPEKAFIGCLKRYAARAGAGGGAPGAWDGRPGLARYARVSRNGLRDRWDAHYEDKFLPENL
jgi:hypothetical protein